MLSFKGLRILLDVLFESIFEDSPMEAGDQQGLG